MKGCFRQPDMKLHFGRIFTSEKEPSINQITEGVIWKQLLLFFFPIVMGTFFQQLYNTADTVIVGRFVGKKLWLPSAVLLRRSSI